VNIPKVCCNLCHSQIQVDFTHQLVGGMSLRSAGEPGQEWSKIYATPYADCDAHLCRFCEQGLRKLFQDEPDRISICWKGEVADFMLSPKATP
jgi:hypothetical protein